MKKVGSLIVKELKIKADVLSFFCANFEHFGVKVGSDN
jgi:hypothetical protein